MDLSELYRDVILDHYKTPRNFGSLDPADGAADGHNPLCGDRLHLTVQIDGDRIRDVRFEGKGCAISTASASLMTEAVKGKTRAQVARLFDDIHHVLTERDFSPSQDLGKLVALGGVREFPARQVRKLVLAHLERGAGTAGTRPSGSSGSGRPEHIHRMSPSRCAYTKMNR
ncbi:MAG: SUF system NifU family Fe-S cluster assembly protein [Steroidobacteraceae bacterium]